VDVAQDLVRHWVYRYPVSLTAAWVTVFVTLDLTSPPKGAASAAITASISVAIAMLLRSPLRGFAEAAHPAVNWLIRSVLSLFWPVVGARGRDCPLSLWHAPLLWLPQPHNSSAGAASRDPTRISG
jgi:hypothetical protein